MPTLVLENPNDKPVDVRVLSKGGWFSSRKVERELHVEPFAQGMVSLPRGKYYVRYTHAGSGTVWEGDCFKLDEYSAATEGNLRVRPTDSARL